MSLNRKRKPACAAEIFTETKEALPLYTLPAFSKGLPDTWVVTEESKQAFDAGQMRQGYAVIIWQDSPRESKHLFVSLIPAFNKDDKLGRVDKSGKALVPAELFDEVVSQVYFIESDFPLGQNTGDIHTKSVEHLKRSGQMPVDLPSEQIFGAGVFKGANDLTLLNLRNKSLSLNKHSVKYHPLFLMTHYYDSLEAPREVRGADRVDHISRTLPPDITSKLYKTLMEQLPHPSNCVGVLSSTPSIEDCFDWWDLNKHNPILILEMLVITLEIAFARNSCSTWISEILKEINARLKHLPHEEAVVKRSQILHSSSFAGLDTILARALDHGDENTIDLLLGFGNKNEIYKCAVVNAKFKAIKVLEDTDLSQELIIKHPESLKQIIEACILADDAEWIHKLFLLNKPLTIKVLLDCLGKLDNWDQLSNVAAYVCKLFPFEQKNSEGDTLFHVAANLETYTVLQTLVSKEDSAFNTKNKRGELALHYAAKRDRLDNVILLINLYRKKGLSWEDSEAKDEVHNLALFAAANGSHRVAFYLNAGEGDCKKRLKVAGLLYQAALKNLFKGAVKNSNFGLIAEIQAKMPEAFTNSDLFFEAAKEDNIKLFDFVLKQQKDKANYIGRVDDKKQTALHIAVNARAKMVFKLVFTYADVNDFANHVFPPLDGEEKRVSNWDQVDVNGDTPLTLILKQAKETPPSLEMLLLILHQPIKPARLIGKLLTMVILGNNLELGELIIKEVYKSYAPLLIDVLLKLPKDIKMPSECSFYDLVLQSIVQKIKQKKYYEDKTAVLDEICQHPVIMNLKPNPITLSLFSRPPLLEFIENLRALNGSAPKRNQAPLTPFAP